MSILDVVSFPRSANGTFSIGTMQTYFLVSLSLSFYLRLNCTMLACARLKECDNDDEDRYGVRREVEFEFLFAVKLYNVSMC